MRVLGEDLTASLQSAFDDAQALLGAAPLGSSDGKDRRRGSVPAEADSTTFNESPDDTN